jgi:thiol-disulfide isomerase/thioredoxin
MVRTIFLGMALTAVTPIAALAQSAPIIAEHEAQAVKHPYDEDANAQAMVAAAKQTAARTHKKIMVVFGANWCPDCRALSGVLALDDVHEWADKHYVVVEVDVGRFNKNLDLAKGFGIDLKAIPAVAVATPSGAVVNGPESLALGDARKMSPQEVVDLLAKWSAARPVS